MATCGFPGEGGVMSSLLSAPTEVSETRRPTTGRDPAVDLLRAGALAVVVLGHWLLTVVHWHDGTLSAHNLLDVAPATQWATWPFQVMPLFFAVGGWAAARSWTARPPGRRRTDWVAARLRRLLVPATTYVVVAMAVATGVEAVFGHTASAVSGLLGMHLWFLAVFIPVTAVTPLLCDAVTARGWQIPCGLAAAVVAIDLARFGAGVPGVGWANFVFVWLAFTALGVGAAIRPPRPSRSVVVALCAFGALIAVVAAGWYPHSMVGVGDRSNNTPPTAALGLLGLAQVALAAAGAPRLRHWLQPRCRLRRRVDAAGALGMHAYLWHLCATTIVVALMMTGVGNIEPLTGSWWATRPVWWIVLAVVAAPIIVTAARFDGRRLSRPRESGAVATGPVVVATILASAAFATFALSGVAVDRVTLAAVAAVLSAARLVSRRADGKGRRAPGR